jgi:uncharacterized protein with HEPN domain
MKLDTLKSFHDVVQAAQEIEQYTAGLTLEDFRSDSMLRSAVERQFEIIGEALNRIGRVEPEVLHQITDYRLIIGFRNIISHGYDTVDIQIVWEAVSKYLPTLVREVGELLNEE